MLRRAGNGQPVRAEQGERYQRPGRMKRQIGINRCCDRELPGRADEQGVPVGRLALGIHDGELTGGAGPVLNDDGLPDVSESFGATIRATRSLPPPAAKPTMIRIGFDG